MNVFFSNRKAKDESQNWTMEKKKERDRKRQEIWYYFAVRNQIKKASKIDSIIIQTLETFHDYLCASSLSVSLFHSLSRWLHAKYVIFVCAVSIDNIFFNFRWKRWCTKKATHFLNFVLFFIRIIMDTLCVCLYVCVFMYVYMSGNSSILGFSRVKLSQVINIQNGFCSWKCEIYASSSKVENAETEQTEKKPPGQIKKRRYEAKMRFLSHFRTTVSFPIH